jgi:DNA-binding transcriptional regulator GbsR (MarR family)
MIPAARKQFFLLMGKNYEKYGYPGLAGWIEALLLLEPGKWTQETISTRLSELFPEEDRPTSRASVNRALRLLELYGVVVKSGSRKLGYSYQLDFSSNMITNMFQQFIANNTAFTDELATLKGQFDLDCDQALQTAVDLQIEGYSLFNQVLEKFIESLPLERREAENDPVREE